MAAIGYLLRKSAKNWILDLKNKPQHIVLIAFVVLMLLLASFGGGRSAVENYNQGLISSAFLIVSLVFGGVTIYGGLSETRSFFRMGDVNLMFTSPIRPANVIVYGMIRNIGSLAFAMIFLVYQIGTLRYTFGMTPLMIGSAFLCIFLMLIMSLTTSMCFMLFCSGRPQRQTLLKGILVALLLLLLIYAVAAGKSQSNLSGLAMFTAICGDRVLDAIPIIGWSRGLFVGLISSDTAGAMLFGFLCLALLVAEVIAISHTKSDYYEDVLDGASRKELALQSVKEGKSAYLRHSQKDKTIRKFGINAGKGASVFFYKRMLERKRGAFGVLSITTVFILGSGVFMSVVLHMPYLAFLGTAGMFSLIFQRINSWETELAKIYIFLAPSKPERKLFFVLIPELLTSLIDSVFVFAIGAALFSAGPLDAFFGAVAYISVCVLITGSSVITSRVFGFDTKNPLVQIFAVYLPMIVLGLGIIPAAIVQLSLSAAQSFPLSGILVLMLWNILSAGLLLFLGRGVLTKVN
jgi:hypothetical protein